jgi:hypothetical protein
MRCERAGLIIIMGMYNNQFLHIYNIREWSVIFVVQ